MKRLGVSDELVFTFPTRDTLLLIYIIDCALVRKRKNVWETVRGKLRAIDYIAQLCNIKQSWSDNPALYAATQYVKRRNPGQGSDTLPVSASLMKQIVSYILTNKVYHGLDLSMEEQELARRWFSFRRIWMDKSRVWWYMFAISIMVMCVLGLRGAECYQNAEPEYEGYGLCLDDITIHWQIGKNGKIYASNRYSEATEYVHHVEVRIKNTKTGCVGQSTYLRVGRTHELIEPALLLHHIYHLRES